MISVTVLYPNASDNKFNLDYYCNKHIPFVEAKLGKALKGITVENGLSGESPGSRAANTVVTRLLFDSVEAFEGAFGPHEDAIANDISNYTNIEPVVQIDEVQISR